MLNYIKHMFDRIDNLKTVFVKCKFKNTVRNKNDKNETHFNIFKFHLMIYYVTFIRLYNIHKTYYIFNKKTTYN